MGILLDLVKKHQGIGSIAKPVASYHTESKIKVIDGPCPLKQARAIKILYQIYFYEVTVELGAYIPYDIRLACLACAAHKEHLVLFMRKMFIYSFLDFTI